MLRIAPREPLPAATLGSVRSVLRAVLTGQLRRQFYSDIFHFGPVEDAPRQVATGYMGLAAAIGWGVGLVATLLINPANLAAQVLGAANTFASLVAFLHIRHRRDPRHALDWLLILHLFSVMAIALAHAGVVAPVVLMLPMLAGICALYQRPHMRKYSLMVGVVVVAVCVLSSLGMLGNPTSYTQTPYVVMIFLALLTATLGLGGLAWISMISRDYALEQVQAANEAIVESADRARLALEAARVGLWDVPDAAAKRFRVSESFHAVTGYSGDEFSAIFANVHQFVHPDDVAPLREAFAAGEARATRIRVDFRMLTKSRGYRWFSARARYSTNPDGSTRISGSLQDINFIKVAEEALRSGRDQARAANKAKSDFIAVMSHEVRTPLNAILGSVDVLKRGVHDREAVEMVELIDEAGHGLLAIVNDLLDVSRIDAGKVEINYAPVQLATLVRRAVEFWSPQASDKGLSLEVQSDASDTSLLMMDAGRIRQIVGNLISNAIKFTDKGSVKAHLATHATQDGRVQVTLSVIDTGPGVPDALAETIFAPFEQAPGDASRGGAGLGLFISRRLARMMGGDLTLEPARRGGAHFRLTLVAERSDAVTVPDAGLLAGESSWDGVQLLCVDDNANNRRIAELLLSKLGFQVTLAASGAEAVDLCAMQSFDLILMDIVMPEMDGSQTLQQLRSDEEGLNRTTPVIALTAKLSAADIATYQADGFDGVAGKPIDLAALAGEIGRALNARANRRELVEA